MIKKTDNEIIISKNPTFIILGFMSVFLFSSGALMTFSDFSIDSLKEPTDIAGFIYMLVWLGVMIYFILYSFNEFFKKVTIGKESVKCKTIFGIKEYMWSEINDFGISYMGQARGEGNTYYLYFSTDIRPKKRNGNKKMNKSAIKIIFTSDEANDFLNDAIPFCCENTKIKPFFPPDKSPL